jgi:hypothetical protein
LLLPLQLAARVEEAVRAHQNSDLNVALSQAMAAMLDKVSAPPPLMPVLFHYVYCMCLWDHLPSLPPPPKTPGRRQVLYGADVQAAFNAVHESLPAGEVKEAMGLVGVSADKGESTVDMLAPFGK